MVERSAPWPDVAITPRGTRPHTPKPRLPIRKFRHLMLFCPFSGRLLTPRRWRHFRIDFDAVKFGSVNHQLRHRTSHSDRAPPPPPPHQTCPSAGCRRMAHEWARVFARMSRPPLENAMFPQVRSLVLVGQTD